MNGEEKEVRSRASSIAATMQQAWASEVRLLEEGYHGVRLLARPGPVLLCDNPSQATLALEHSTASSIAIAHGSDGDRGVCDVVGCFGEGRVVQPGFLKPGKPYQKLGIHRWWRASGTGGVLSKITEERRPYL